MSPSHSPLLALRSSSSSASRSSSRERLLRAVQQAGLEGRIRIGVSPPPPLADPTPSLRSEDAAFPPDALLRPLERRREGALIQLSGERSSGRTSLAYRLAAGATARGELVGWVDLADALDPRYLRRSGLDLASLLWVRPREARVALRAAELLVKTGFGLVVVDLGGSSPFERRSPNATRAASGRPTDRQGLERVGTGAWLRLQRAIRATRATGVVLGPAHVAGAISSLGLHSVRSHALFDHGLFEGLEACVEVVRHRTGPPGATFPFRVLQRA